MSPATVFLFPPVYAASGAGGSGGSGTGVGGDDDEEEEGGERDRTQHDGTDAACEPPPPQPFGYWDVTSLGGEAKCRCGSAFHGKPSRARSNLKMHILRKHLKVRKHTCEVLGCGWSFFSRSTLLSHMRWHNEDKPFQCTNCQRKFYSKRHLEQHKTCRSSAGEWGSHVSHARVRIGVFDAT